MVDDIKTSKVVFDTEPVENAPDQEENQSWIGAPKTEEAVEFLREVLTGQVAVAQEEIQRLAKEKGIKYPTLKLAKKKLPIKSESHGYGKDKQWFWLLEDHNKRREY